ncbi:peroxiredoxin [Leucobacter albus]|uniref:Peroxiredoxin n=1 Tax=Leucobacter albus TaxID=272210 RepID=A0ABW3TQM2_9MICO
MTHPTELPEGLPVPVDDGRAAHLPGRQLPRLTLPASDGAMVSLGSFGAGRTVVYLYPLTGSPDGELPEGWESIPGARGCTSEACDFRDHFRELQAAGVTAVYGLSSQGSAYQAEVGDRLRLPFPMLSDTGFALAAALDLPTFEAPGEGRLYSRLTLIVLDGVIEHVFYPVFPPNTHAQRVLDWVLAHPAGGADG